MKKIIFILLLFSLPVVAQRATIYGIGDSTMATKKDPSVNPEFGWGQVFPQFLKETISFQNHAVNGRSTKSFMEEKRWDSIQKLLKKGDYVFIQFGHNDAKINDPKRYTNPHTSYRYNLVKFITDTRAKGAIPILFTSIARRNFNEYGVLVSTHGDYTLETRWVAKEYNVPLIDLEYLSEQLEISYGPEASKKLHLHFKKGEHPYYAEDKADDTHLSEMGALEIAKRAVKELKKLSSPECKILVNSLK